MNSIRNLFVILFSMSVIMPAYAVDVIVNPPAGNPDNGEIFEISIDVSAGIDTIGSYSFNVSFDPNVIIINDIRGGDNTAFSFPPITNSSLFASGTTPIVSAQALSNSPAGNVSLAVIEFMAVGSTGALSPITLQVFELNDGLIQPLPASVFSSSVRLSFDGGTDTDMDGLSDQGENDAGTDVSNADTDGDSLLDGFEVFGGLDPLDDGSSDPSQGAAGDPDNDGLTNFIEQAIGSNPTNADTDGDGLEDGVELSMGTSATNSDSDGDGMSDGFEVANGLDPGDDGSTNPLYGASGDLDSDGISNIDEFLAGLNPNSTDSDGDGLEDGYEIGNNLDPLDDGSVDPNQGALGDPDVDGFANITEANQGSDPQNNHSQPVNVLLSMAVGEQMLIRPTNIGINFTTFDYLAELNANGEAATYLQVIGAGNTIFEATWSGGVAAGDNVVLVPGQGVLVKFGAATSILYTGVNTCTSYDLNVGANLFGLPCIPVGESAFGILSKLGQDLATSIQRFNTQTSLFEVAYFSENAVVGSDFPIEQGVSYLLNLTTPISGFDPLP